MPIRNGEGATRAGYTERATAHKPCAMRRRVGWHECASWYPRAARTCVTLTHARTTPKRNRRVLAVSQVGTALGLSSLDHNLLAGRNTMRHANHGIRSILTILASFALTAFAPTARAQAPDFDAATWTSLSCAAGDPAGDESPSAVDLGGDAAHPAAFFAHDASYLYFRYRVNGDPAGAGGFQSYAWNALMQVPSGNPFQYQYELSLDGKSDTIQIWANTS